MGTSCGCSTIAVSRSESRANHHIDLLSGRFACNSDFVPGHPAFSSGGSGGAVAGFNVAALVMDGSARGSARGGRHADHVWGAVGGEHARVHGGWMVRCIRLSAVFQTRGEEERVSRHSALTMSVVNAPQEPNP